MPAWSSAKFEELSQELSRPLIIEPQYLMADFSGDGFKDVAIFVERIDDHKKGILFIFQQSENTYLIGAGNNFGPGGDDYYWADSWEVFEDRVTYEMTFKDNGDIDGTKTVKLERDAISIREDEGSGGLIYFDGTNFKWIQHGD